MGAAAGDVMGLGFYRVLLVFVSFLDVFVSFLDVFVSFLDVFVSFLDVFEALSVLASSISDEANGLFLRLWSPSYEVIFC